MFAVIAASVFAACHNQDAGLNTSTTPDTTLSAEPEVVEETVAELPNPSDVAFKEALMAFRAKDNTEAARYILLAIAEIKAEIPSTLEPTSQQLIEKNLTTLQGLANRVKNGKVANEEELIDLFGHVDMMTAQEYFLLAQVVAVKEPNKAASWSQRAKIRIEGAEKKLKGESQAECSRILNHVRAALKKGDQRADNIGNTAGEHVEQLFAWLKTHAAKMGINPPPSTNF